MMKDVQMLILILVEEVVLLGGIIRPEILDVFVDLTLILHLLEILYHLKGGSATYGVVDKLFLSCLFIQVNERRRGMTVQYRHTDTLAGDDRILCRNYDSVLNMTPYS